MLKRNVVIIILTNEFNKYGDVVPINKLKHSYTIATIIDKQLPTSTVNHDNESVRQWHFVRASFTVWHSGVVFVCGILSRGISSVHPGGHTYINLVTIKTY